MEYGLDHHSWKNALTEKALRKGYTRLRSPRLDGWRTRVILLTLGKHTEMSMLAVAASRLWPPDAISLLPSSILVASTLATFSGKRDLTSSSKMPDADCDKCRAESHIVLEPSSDKLVRMRDPPRR